MNPPSANAAPEITRDSLNQARAQGADALKDFVRGNPADRKEQANRARKTLEIFKEHMQGLSDTEKKMIINATRQVIQEAVNDANEQVRKDADTRLVELDQAQKNKVQERQQQLDDLLHTQKMVLEEEGRLAPPATKNDSWLPQTVDPREWTGKQIAVVSAATLGAVGLYALWRRWRGGESNDKSKNGDAKNSYWDKAVYWIPVVGLVAVGVVAGHHVLMKIDAYEKAYTTLQKKVEGVLDWGKSKLPGHKEGKYGLEPEALKHAEDIYRKVRGEDPKDIEEIRTSVFGLKAGETSPQFEDFLKDMKEKYATKEVGEVTYSRADVALRNYEACLEVGLSQLGHWLELHSVDIALITVVADRTGLFTIKDIIQGGGSIVQKSAAVAAQLGKFAIRHPLVSLFGVGGSILGIRTALSVGTKLSIPDNLQELGVAYAKDLPLVLGDVNEAVQKQLQSFREDGKYLAQIGSDFSTWIGGAIEEVGNKIINATPDAIGLTKEEVIEKRNSACMDSLRVCLEDNKKMAIASNKKAKDGVVKKLDTALQQLAEFNTAFIAGRNGPTVSVEKSQQALQSLEETLKDPDIGITFVKKEGIVRWQINGKEADLCVDPDITDKEKILELSNKIRPLGQGDRDFVFFRGIENLRVKLEEGMQRGEKLVEGKVMAMVVGNLLYITDPDNHEEFWIVPLYLAKDLFSDKSASEQLANLAVATTGASIMSLNMYALSVLKRGLIGGVVFKRSWANIAGSVNPIVSPLKLVRNAARGMIDIETFMKLGMWGEDGGRFFNTLLARSGVRPEWIGMIRHSEDITELRRVGKLIGVGHLENISLKVVKERLEREVLYRLEHTKMFDFKNLSGNLKTGNYRAMYEKAAEWYKTRSVVSKAAGRVSGALDSVLDPREFIATFLRDESSVGTAAARVAAGSAAPTAPGAPATAPQPPTAPGANNAVKAGAESVEDAAKIELADNLAKEAKRLEQIADAAEAANAPNKAVLRKAATKALEEADEAVHIAETAAKKAAIAGKPLSVAQLSRFGKSVRLMKGMMVKGLKWGGPAFEAYMVWDYLYNDRPELAKQLESETDPTKREVLGNRISDSDKATGVNIVAGVACATGVGMPIGLTLVAGSIFYSSTVGKYGEYEDYLTDTQSRLENYPPGLVLDGIAKNYSPWFGRETINAGFEGRRRIGYQAYFGQSADRLPLLQLDDLPEHRQKDAEKAGGLKPYMIEKQKELKEFFIGAAVGYVHQTTGGKYTMITEEQLRRAEAYALAISEQWVDDLRSETMDSQGNRTRPERENRIPYLAPVVNQGGELRKADDVAYATLQRQWEKAAAGLTWIQNNEETKELFAGRFTFEILSRVKHKMALRDQQIMGLSRWYSGKQDMQALARYGYAIRIQEIISRSLNEAKAGKKFGRFELDKVVADIDSVLNEDAEKMAESMEGRVNENQVMRQGRLGTLSFAGMAQFLQAHPAGGEETVTDERQKEVIRREKRQSAGEAFMTEVGANANNGYYTKQYGAWVNNYLYMKFDDGEGKWKVNMGNADEWHDPAAIWWKMYTGQDKYDNLRNRLIQINGIS